MSLLCTASSESKSEKKSNKTRNISQLGLLSERFFFYEENSMTTRTRVINAGFIEAGFKYNIDDTDN